MEQREESSERSERQVGGSLAARNGRQQLKWRLGHVTVAVVALSLIGITERWFSWRWTLMKTGSATEDIGRNV
jgi:hypothetical protein